MIRVSDSIRQREHFIFSLKVIIWHKIKLTKIKFKYVVMGYWFILLLSSFTDYKSKQTCMKLKLLFIIIVFCLFNKISAQNGDPSVFGDNVWNVYAYNYTDNTFPSSNYQGFYIESDLSFDTQTRWNLGGSPSDASGYVGNAVGNDDHSYAAKRQGFTPGYYAIDIPGHDDQAYLLVNGVEVWSHMDCCDSHSDVWEGVLDANSTIEYRVTETGGGGSYGAIKIAMVTIDAVVAPFSSSSCLTTVTVTATGGQYPYTGTGVFTVGSGTHNYTVTDSYGATSSTTVLVKDDSKPTIITQNITVNLEADGQVVLTPEMIDNNSVDNCGIVSMSLDRTTFSCADIGAGAASEPIAFTNGPNASQNIHSWGGGYNPNTNEFWYPGWAGSTIYKYNALLHTTTGNFNAPVGSIMQLWMDKSSSDYYTANWGNRTINRISGNTVVWSHDTGATASAVTTSDLYVFAMSYYTNTIIVLDKTTGAVVKNITLPGTFQTYGGLVYANGIIYISGSDVNGLSTVRYTMNAIHSFDANTGAYISSVATSQQAYNTAFDGETIWISDSSSGSNIISGYKISDGDAYENEVFGKNVTLTVTDAAGNTAVGTARVIVKDLMAPVITSNGDINADTDSGVCGATVVVSASAADNCSVGAPTGVRSDGELLSGLYPTGTTTIAWNVTDANGNAAVEVIQTVIVSDNEVPVITADADINVNVDSGVCGANVTVVSATATDNCSVGTPTGVRNDGLLLSDLYPTGTTTIAWNVTDVNGNVAVEATQTVTVIDNEMPTALAQDITVQLDATGTVSITAAQINNGSSDICGIATLELDTTLFNCTNVGNNNVILTVTDINGNESTTTAIVTVQDVTSPTVLAHDITVQLGTTGTVSITPAQINNGSSDTCGIASVTVSPDTFTCDNVGDNAVTLTVTDINGNALTATAIVKVNSFTVNTITRNLDTLVADEVSATTYQWMSCNGGIYANLPGEINQSFTATATGSYSVDVTKNGCTQRSTCFDITTLGNNDFDFNSKLSVYPNPFNDVISINMDSNAKIEIYNLLGETIYNKKINSGSTLLNLSNNASGMYLMKITAENNQSKTVKIVKK
jgi:hypothetical protein